MADNYIEKQYDDYIARKAAQDHKARLAWQRKLKAYKEKLAQEKASKQEISTPKNDTI